jgi:hypothetical protein
MKSFSYLPFSKGDAIPEKEVTERGVSPSFFSSPFP